jgi:heme oxygenase (biliverdin-producing, ferredoxin)
VRLRQATQPLHTATERAGAMASLLAGRLTHAGYLALLENLQALYAALERALQDNAQQTWLQAIDLAALQRGPALGADLSPWPAQSHEVLPATREYVDRLQALGCASDPALLAHVYTRYLGDLHGGQIMQTIVRRLYPSQGTAFHDFGDVHRVQRLRAQLREGLDSACLSAEQADRVVAEACWSFNQHRCIFEALEAPAADR